MGKNPHPHVDNWKEAGFWSGACVCGVCVCESPGQVIPEIFIRICVQCNEHTMDWSRYASCLAPLLLNITPVSTTILKSICRRHPLIKKLPRTMQMCHYAKISKDALANIKVQVSLYSRDSSQIDTRMLWPWRAHAHNSINPVNPMTENAWGPSSREHQTALECTCSPLRFTHDAKTPAKSNIDMHHATHADKHPRHWHVAKKIVYT